MPDSFDCAISQKSDLRELIPEFFCFPEMFLNMNELNLGEISDGKGSTKLVGGVKMPIWANYNEYIFVGKHRELLESSEINEKINEWFNIIFGSKQKGKEAKKIGNLFISQTYEDFDEIYNKGSKSEKTYQCRMVEFGVTPNQLFKYDTYKRQNINDISRIRRNLLFNVLQKKNKKADQTGKELDLEEIKVNIEENISKMFIFIVKKKDKKKERIYLLTNNKVKIYTKYDKNQFFKTTLKDKDKDKTKEKQIENDQKDGDGLVKHKDGYEYNGKFKNNKFNGKGTLNWKDGSYYEGEFKDNFFNGMGYLEGSNKHIYSGYFKNGAFNGKGEFKWIDRLDEEKYKGSYSNGKKDGEGIFYFKNGDIFKGNWECGKPHGEGVYETKNRKYFGNWRQGMFMQITEVEDKEGAEEEHFNLNFKTPDEDINFLEHISNSLISNTIKSTILASIEIIK